MVDLSSIHVFLHILGFTWVPKLYMCSLQIDVGMTFLQACQSFKFPRSGEELHDVLLVILLVSLPMCVVVGF